MTGMVFSEQNESMSWHDRFRMPLLGGGPNTVVTIGSCEMPPGIYYVGDLTHVLDTENCEALDRVRNGGCGKFSLDNGRVVVVYNLPSNGCRKRQYQDMQGRVYSVESGTIGLTLAKGLESEYSDRGLPTSPQLTGEDWYATITRLAHVMRYNDQFECDSVIKTLVGGNAFGCDCEVALVRMGTGVCIDTDESCYNDADETESDDEESELDYRAARGPEM